MRITEIVMLAPGMAVMTIGGTFILTRVTASYAVADNGLLISSAISALVDRRVQIRQAMTT